MRVLQQQDQHFAVTDGLFLGLRSLGATSDSEKLI
jgi:hypothetical protein